jgi:hypothetical protein
MCVKFDAARRRSGVAFAALLSMLAASGLLFISCAPDEVEGYVIREEWSAYECVVWLRLDGGDAVDVRLVLAGGGRRGYDAAALKAAALTGKRLRCRLEAGRRAVASFIVRPGKIIELRRIGYR